MVFIRNWPFLIFFNFGLVGQDCVFYHIPERKTPFKAIKTKILKSKN